MRIQHNILAMNAYRNYSNNTSAVAKNLEKLASGYKINRAGDDAAGLAISEKMRAQITGLNAAQKNVKDGVSLVKTAEGAMQEIHDMLNRMDYLATQSANGTYDDDVDRNNLQKEVNALKEEINRIADSANFNGIKLLDGTKSAKSTSALGAATAQVLASMDGSAPSKAGAAEITLKLSNNAAANSTVLEPKTSTDGTPLTKATAATATLTMGKPTDLKFTGTVNGADLDADGVATIDISGSKWKSGDSISVTLADGTTKTYTQAANNAVSDLKDAMAADGIVLDDSTDTAAKAATAPKITISSGNDIEIGTDIADIADLEYASGKKLGDLFDIEVFAKGSTSAKADTAKVAAEDKIVLTAKKEGAQATAVDTAMKDIAVTHGSTAEYVKGTNEAYTSVPATVTQYDLEIDVTKLRGGMSIDIGGNKITFSTDGTANSTTNVNLNDTDANIAAALKTALDNIFSTTNKFDTAKTTGELDGTTYKYHAQGAGNNIKGDTSNNNVATTNMGEVRVFDANGKETTGNDPAVKSTYTSVSEVEDTSGTPDAFAKVTYEIDESKLTAGSKVTIGDGKIIEIVDGTKVAEDVANGKLTLASFKSTKLGEALEKMGYTSGKVTATSSNSKTTITIKGTTVGEEAETLAAGAGKVSFLSAEDAPASEATVTNGMTITAGTTTIANIKAAAMPDGADGTTKTLNDLFKITVNGNVQSDSYVIKEGDEIKFTAKNNGRYDDSVISKFDFTGSVDSLTKRNGWDEGEGASGDKTHYDLTIDLAKAAGGNSFTFGNVNDSSVTFELSFDPKGTANDTIGKDENKDIAGNGERVVINLYGLSDADAQAKIYTQVKNKMDAAGFDVTRAISGSKVTLNLDAKKEGNEWNLGNIRTSSASGALTNPVYQPAGGNAGGSKGTMAQVTYKFDVDQLQVGDTLTFGDTTIHIGEATKKESTDSGMKFIVSLDEIQTDPNAAIVTTLEAAGYKSGQVKFDTTNKSVTITGIKTGETAEALKAGGAKLSLGSSTGRALEEGGLTLQIGDTSDSYNQMIVSIGSMKTSAMGIDGINISTQGGAKDAIAVIKNAINYVSSVRGDLGATQNRLEHTANNLSVMAENIQDAESTIRDTDIAEEMMAYTKNNILVQSAQAMLAQANQVPQGVLQLLG